MLVQLQGYIIADIQVYYNIILMYVYNVYLGISFPPQFPDVGGNRGRSEATNNSVSQFCIARSKSANSNSAMTEPVKPQPEFGPPAKEVVRMQLPSTEAVRPPCQVVAKIDCLPNELLMWIFHLCICVPLIANPSCDVHHHLKR